MIFFFGCGVIGKSCYSILISVCFFYIDFCVILYHLIIYVYHFSYRVCELLYETRKEYHKILNCYLKDTSRQVINIYI